jgi:hypothetical protein
MSKRAERALVQMADRIDELADVLTLRGQAA